jgi:hypothetical protein
MHLTCSEAYVGLGRDLEVLEVLCTVSYASMSSNGELTLSVESDVSGLDFSLLPSSAFFVYRSKTRLTLTSTLFPQRTIGMFSQTRSKSRCQLGTFL